MIRSLLLVLLLSALLFGEQKTSLESTQDSSVALESVKEDSIDQSSNNDTAVTPTKLNLDLTEDTLSSDLLTVEELTKPRVYNYRYQIVSGVAMMLFFGIMLGTTQSMNPR